MNEQQTSTNSSPVSASGMNLWLWVGVGVVVAAGLFAFWYYYAYSPEVPPTVNLSEEVSQREPPDDLTEVSGDLDALKVNDLNSELGDIDKELAL